MPTTLQNFYKSTVSIDWSVGTGNFYVTTKPTPTAGWLVLSPNNATLREIVQYTATGTDGNGDFVTLSVRGVGGTTEQVHGQGEPIRMNITAEHWEQFKEDTQDSLDVMTGNIADIATDLANVSITAGNAKASDVIYGNTKLSVAPVSSSDPIALGSNDPKLTTSSGTALTGTTNKIVDTIDVSSTSSANKIPRYDSNGLLPIGLSLSLFGDGSDGAVTISSNTTLTRDMYYTNLTINSTFELSTAGYRIYVSGTLTNNGTIKNNGSDATNDVGGAGGLSGSLSGGGAGGNGFKPGTSWGGGGGGGGGIVWIAAYIIAVQGTITAVGGNGANGIYTGGIGGAGVGIAGSSITKTLIQTGSGGAGGSSSGGAGGAGGTISSSSQSTRNSLIMNLFIDTSSLLSLRGGGGGGGGSCAVVGDAGGGGGGQGGVIYQLYHTLTTSGTTSVAGGTKGTKSGAPANDGVNGSSGLVVAIQI